MSSGSAESDRSVSAEPEVEAEARPELASAPVAESSLIEQVVGATSVAAETRDAGASGRLDQFLAEPKIGPSLETWFGRSFDQLTPEQLVRRLNRDVAQLDRLINAQLNAILHAPEFQKLEASWRGVEYLARAADEEGNPRIKIKVLNVSWRELERDFERAAEFDQSQVFRKVYEQEFGSPGGEPYSALIGDYEIHPRPGPGHPHDDMGILTSLSQVAAASFCPFLTNVDPSMFGLDAFDGMENRLDHAGTFQRTEYVKWNALRNSEDARFVGLFMPRVLMRLPYGDDGSRIDEFQFREDVSANDRSGYLWGGASYAMGSTLMRAFSQSGWLANIRGVTRGIDGGGLVANLPVHCFATDKWGVAPKFSTDVVITEELERDLSELGFIPLCHCKDTEFSAFYSNQSIQKPKKYDRAAATVNARISSMLQYMFCVSRFAHYIKVLGRDKTGTFAEADELERFLQDWVVRYVTVDAEASPETKARFPLRQAQVSIRRHPYKPGSYECVMHLAPHYELDELSASVQLRTELAPLSS